MSDGDDDDDGAGLGFGGGGGGLLSDDLGEGGSSGYDRVRVELDHLNLVPVGSPAAFTIRVAGGDDAELAVSVQGEQKE